MVDCPIELLQCLFRSAQHCVIDPQPVGSKNAAWIHLLVQNKYGGFLLQVARYVGMIKRGSLEILFLCESRILELVGLGKIPSGSLIVADAEIGTAEHAVSGTE